MKNTPLLFKNEELKARKPVFETNVHALVHLAFSVLRLSFSNDTDSFEAIKGQVILIVLVQSARTDMNHLVEYFEHV